MVITAWIEFTGSVESRARAGIISLLEATGVDLRAPDGTGGGSLGLAVFGAVDDHLVSLLRNKAPNATVLAISACSSPLKSREQWSLIHTGASDVLQWPTPESADDVVCRRLVRQRGQAPRPDAPASPGRPRRHAGRHPRR
jgi:hypothetical protein